MAASRRRARIVAGFKSYRWLVVGAVCVGAFMGQVDSSIAQMLLPELELEFGASLSTVSWVAVACASSPFGSSRGRYVTRCPNPSGRCASA